MTEMETLQAEIKLDFKDRELLLQALTHSSFANEQPVPVSSNERLEFLGDAVLELAVSELLMRAFPDLPEGDLTKKRASIVCEESLVYFARALGLGRYLRLGRGEEMSRGRERPSVLADAFEALLGAMYLDRGLDAVKSLMSALLETYSLEEGEVFFDYKTALQEHLQSHRGHRFEYRLLYTEGPDHDKRFSVGVFVDGRQVAQGRGRSKKQAEQAAACQALEILQKTEAAGENK